MCCGCCSSSTLLQLFLLKKGSSRHVLCPLLSCCSLGFVKLTGGNASPCHLPLEEEEEDFS